MPFVILTTGRRKNLSNYWFASGTPTFLADMLRKTNYDLRKLDGMQVSAASLTDGRRYAKYAQNTPTLFSHTRARNNKVKDISTDDDPEDETECEGTEPCTPCLPSSKTTAGPHR